MAVDFTRWDSDPIWAVDTWDLRPAWIRPTRPGTMRWTAQRTVEPTIEPIDLAMAKVHIKQDSPDDDALIANLIMTARDEVERLTGLSLLPQTWKLYLDRFPRQDRRESWGISSSYPYGAILLPRYPVQSITNIQWFGSDNSTNTVTSTDYVVDLVSRPPRIAPAYLKTWPNNSLVPANGVVVTFVAGYASTYQVPPGLKQAMLLMIGHWYMNREQVVAEPRLAHGVDMPWAAHELLARHTPPLVG